MKNYEMKKRLHLKEQHAVNGLYLIVPDFSVAKCLLLILFVPDNLGFDLRNIGLAFIGGCA